MRNLHISKKNLYFISGVCLLLLVGCSSEKKIADNPKPLTDPSKVTQNETVEANPLEGLQDVLATVNDTEILKTDLEKIYGAISMQAKMAKQDISDKEIIEGILEQLISTELIKQESARQNIAPSDEDVETAFKALQGNFHDKETFEKAISEKGMTVEVLREDIKKQLAIKEVIEKEIQSKISVSDKDVREFYESNKQTFKTEKGVRAAHILIKLEEGAEKAKEEEAKKKTNEILAKAKSGEDFSELAKKHSEGPSAPAGGDLGFFTKGQMVKPFEEAAFALNKDEISDVVKTRFGLHIIKVTEKKEEGIASFEEVKDSVDGYLTKMKGEKLFAEYIERLRSKAKIEKKI